MKLQFSALATSCCLSNNGLDLAYFVFQFYSIKLNGGEAIIMELSKKCHAFLAPSPFDSMPTLSTSCAPTEIKKKLNGYLLHKFTGTELH